MMTYKKTKKEINHIAKDIRNNKDLNSVEKNVMYKNRINIFYANNKNSIGNDTLIKRYNHISAYSKEAYAASVSLVFGAIGSIIVEISKMEGIVCIISALFSICMTLLIFIALMLVYKDSYDNELSRYEATLIRDILNDREQQAEKQLLVKKKARIKRCKNSNLK